MDHLSWDGISLFADFIFPAFLFIMGMSIPMTVSHSKPLRLKNIIRIIALFGLGLFLNLL
jgi:predicted acyltransferase